MMKWEIILAVVMAIASTLGASAAAQPPNPLPERDVGGGVRGVFASKCAACHGPDLAKPKGQFGYVLDLRKVANNPEMVIPFRPDESELWVLVGRGEMPPPNSSRVPMTVTEKEIVRAWIAAGSPEPKPQVPRGSGVVAATEPSAESASVPTTARAIRWLGKFHLLALHFPIALMLAAGVGETVAVWRGSRVPRTAVLFCLTLAAVAAVPTVALGWLHAAAGNGVGSPPVLAAHRWLGTVGGAWVIGTALGAWRDARRDLRGRSVQLALAIGIVLVAVTAHLGGLMAHGGEFFEW